MDHETLYRTAITADGLFGEALAAQFGIHACRWHPGKYNAATQAAYDAKVAADQAWLASCKNRRQTAR